MSFGKIMKTIPSSLVGLCDVFVEVDKRDFRILQLTDMQIIDAGQRRTPDRISDEKISYWATDRADANCYSHIRDLVAQSAPDLIIVTGDIVYGEFDDSGRIQREFSNLLGSFGIPWAPVFGNHDNESTVGIDWQCDLYENAPNCLFRRGTCTGYGNYTVGIVYKGELLRVLYLLDSHGCRHAHSPEARVGAGLYDDQLARVKQTAEAIEASLGTMVSGFAAYHIPTPEFALAELEKYGKGNTDYYTLGADLPSQDGDFGTKREKYKCFGESDLTPFWCLCGIDGVFVGHCHKNNTVILYNGVRLVFGLKTGAYDYYTNGQLGGTVIDCKAAGFDVHHIPTLVPYDPPFPM